MNMLNVLAQKPVDSEYVYLTIHAYQYMMHLILHCILDNLLDSANISLNATCIETFNFFTFYFEIPKVID